MNKLNLMLYVPSVDFTNLKPVGLFENKAYGFVVLATGERSGVIVKGCDSTRYYVGKAAETWVKFTDEDIWQKLPIGTTVTFIQT